MNDFHTKSKEEVFSELKTSEKGLTNEEAEKRLEKYGKNTIKRTHRLRSFKIFLQQFNSFLIYILIIAAAISFFIQHFVDGFVISIVVVLNAVIGFSQQYKAEKALYSLRKLIIPKSRVIREQRIMEILSSEIVPGDIVILNSGDKINADCRILETENTQTNEAVLTGESMPVNKSINKLPKNTIIAERTNMLFTGTQVVRGNAKAVVVTTGMQTAFGKIAKSLQEIEPQKTPMQKRLDKFSKQIGFFVLIFVVLVALLGLLETLNMLDMFLTAVALAVSAIPEGLPAVLTVSFAISSLAMSKQNVIIRRLPAVESLGSVSVICTDKTGTITEEKMNVERIFVNNNFYMKKDGEIYLKNKKVDPNKNKELYQLLKCSVLCNNARFESINSKYEFIGDPTEVALVSAALDLGINKKLLAEAEPSIKKFEFDSRRKMMSVVRNNGRHNLMYSKGAIEKILEISKFELINGQIINLSEKRKRDLLLYSKEMEENALRVLAFAYKNLSSSNDMKEKGLIFLGFTGMIDPPRKEVKNAIQQCKEAGIKIKMITGDSQATAVAIAKQIGIGLTAMTGRELEKMNDIDLTNSIDDITVFARIDPPQKLRILKILQQKAEVVAMTGDGINDALALKAADIGISMGKRGTDVARDVSDAVLIDDNFASIVEGVKQGRKTYDNIKKFTKYFLAVNLDEILLVLFALSMGLLYGTDKWFIPLLPLQILWMNLITDSFPALSLVFEKEEDVMRTSPRKEKSILCRSSKPLWDIKFFSNKWLNYAVLLSLVLHLILLYTPLGSLFKLVPLSMTDWLLILPFTVSGLIVFEGVKFVRRKLSL
jgi:Ca2+-transporting ATPase